MPKIAISYRRADSAQIAGRIRDRLIARYGEDSVFIDIYSVPLGGEFPQHVREVWSKTDALLALIGPAWLRGGDKISLTVAMQHLAVPFLLLLIAHYMIINAFDLDALFLSLVSFLVPLPFGAGFYWKTRTSPAIGFAGGVALGVIAAAAMSVSASIRYNQPIWPSSTLEWLENLEYTVIITLGFWTGNMLARLPQISRLFKEREDWVQVEIATALDKRIPIIPVLLDGATMPASQSLPRNIREIAYRNATQIHSGPDFDSHMTRLIGGIDTILDNMPIQRD